MTSRKEVFFCIAPREQLGIEEHNENHGETEAKKSARDYFTRTMTDALFEVWKFAFVYFSAELIDQHIEISPLITEYHADTESIIDDDKRKTNCDRESA